LLAIGRKAQPPGSFEEEGELLHPSFGFFRKLLPDTNVSFKDYYDTHPVKKPFRSLWKGIGKTSSGTVILLNVQSDNDTLEEERLNAVSYLCTKGLPIKYIDLVLLKEGFLGKRFEQMKSDWIERNAMRNSKLGFPNQMYLCCMSLTGAFDSEDSE